MEMAVNLVPRRERFTPIWLLLMMSYGVWSVYSMEGRLLVNRTLVRGAKATGAVCLDGSLPAYHLHRGFGSGAFNWLLQFEGGGWCNDINSCLERAKTRRGSTRYMNKFEIFSGILSNSASLNPVFCSFHSHCCCTTLHLSQVERVSVALLVRPSHSLLCCYCVYMIIVSWETDTIEAR